MILNFIIILISIIYILIIIATLYIILYEKEIKVKKDINTVLVTDGKINNELFDKSNLIKINSDPCNYIGYISNLELIFNNHITINHTYENFGNVKIYPINYIDKNITENKKIMVHYQKNKLYILFIADKDIDEIDKLKLKSIKVSYNSKFF